MNQKGSVLVFVTLMIVVLIFMVGMGLDIGNVTYTRSMGQGAVDASALSAVTAIPSGSMDAVAFRAGVLDNPYPGKEMNPITGNNIILMKYNEDGALNRVTDIKDANAVRVSLENKNPYGATNPPSAIKVPMFLTPILGAAPVADINVTATAVLKGRPDLPVALKGCSIGVQYLFKSPDKSNENECWTTYTKSPSSGKTINEMLKDQSCQVIPPAGTGTPIDLTNATQDNNYETLLDYHGPFNGQQCYLLPVVRSSSKCTEVDEPIEKFAKVCITGVQAGGKPDSQAGTSHWVKADVKSCDITLLGTSSKCATAVLVRDRPSGM